jgi:hypothetical protein
MKQIKRWDFSIYLYFRFKEGHESSRARKPIKIVLSKWFECKEGIEI